MYFSGPKTPSIIRDFIVPSDFSWKLIKSYFAALPQLNTNFSFHRDVLWIFTANWLQNYLFVLPYAIPVIDSHSFNKTKNIICSLKAKGKLFELFKMELSVVTVIIFSYCTICIVGWLTNQLVTVAHPELPLKPA